MELQNFRTKKTIPRRHSCPSGHAAEAALRPSAHMKDRVGIGDRNRAPGARLFANKCDVHADTFMQTVTTHLLNRTHLNRTLDHFKNYNSILVVNLKSSIIVSTLKRDKTESNLSVWLPKLRPGWDFVEPATQLGGNKVCRGDIRRRRLRLRLPRWEFGSCLLRQSSGK